MCAWWDDERLDDKPQLFEDDVITSTSTNQMMKDLIGCFFYRWAHSCLGINIQKYKNLSVMQGSICRGGCGGLTPPLVVDDPLTGDRQFWSGGVGFDPPSPLQQDQDGMPHCGVLHLVVSAHWCSSAQTDRQVAILIRTSMLCRGWRLADIHHLTSRRANSRNQSSFTRIKNCFCNRVKMKL